MNERSRIEVLERDVRRLGMLAEDRIGRMPRPMSGGGGLAYALFQISGLGDGNALHGSEVVDGVPGAAVVGIALPYELRGTFWAGQTKNGYAYSGLGLHKRRSRRVSDESTEDQEITQPYYVGLRILCRKMVTAGPVTTTIPGQGVVTCEWQDVNEIGRDFARIYTPG